MAGYIAVHVHEQNDDGLTVECFTQQSEVLGPYPVLKIGEVTIFPKPDTLRRLAEALDRWFLEEEQVSDMCPVCDEVKGQCACDY